MGFRTIEQKMNAATVWDGAAPTGAHERAITPNAADNVTAATKTWVFANGAFVAGDVGKKLLVLNATTPGNNGVFTIATVVDPTTITTVEAPAGDETFSGGTVTGDIFAATSAPSIGYDMESYPESVMGGLFDFGQTRPLGIAQIVIQFGSGTTGWTLELIDKDGVAVTVATGSSLSYFANYASGEPGAGLILLQGQKLKLTSTGGPTTASRARITSDTAPTI